MVAMGFYGVWPGEAGQGQAMLGKARQGYSRRHQKWWRWAFTGYGPAMLGMARCGKARRGFYLHRRTKVVGKHLKVQDMGTDVLGVKLEGGRRTPEPIHFRVMFPGGDVDIVQTIDDDYWIHIRVNHKDDWGDPDRRPEAKVTDASLDLLDKPGSQVDVGDFNNPSLYHLAVRVTRNKDGNFKTPD
jgi:hypothetical protein